VRASLCYSCSSAKLTREHNDSNVLVLASAFVSQAQAKRIVGVWLATPFAGGRHQRRLNQIKAIEKDIKKWTA
jgi:ribose 5-phosphate isomerase B